MAKAHPKDDKDKLPPLPPKARVRLNEVGASNTRVGVRDEGIANEFDYPWYKVAWSNGVEETVHRGWLEEVT